MVEQTAQPVVRRIGINDLFDALSKGLSDFNAKPSHIVFLAIMYPLFGVVLWFLLIQEERWPLIFPLGAGFSLVGPSAALAFYELSRRREMGLDFSWSAVLTGIRKDAILTILFLTGVLLVIFALWLAAAQVIYDQTLGPDLPPSIRDLIAQVFSTPEGMQLLIVGNVVGFFFALAVLMMSAVSFPMVLDRPVSAFTAMGTSARAVLGNPVTMMVWGLILVTGLAVGFALVMMGLAVVLPILGHATWHLYRKVVEPA